MQDGNNLFSSFNSLFLNTTIMKKLQLQLKLTLMSVLASLMLVMSCKTEDPTPVDPKLEFLPVLNENFSFQVNGNNVVFTTTINGNVWVTTSGVDYTFVDKTVTVNLPNQGTYSFTCNSLGSGEKLTSEPFDVVIAQDDLGFLNVGFWKHLSGGANQSKTWRMDMNADGKCVYFAGPVFYSGADGNPYWSWDVTEEVSAENPYNVDGTQMTSIFNWTPDYPNNTWIMAPRDYGTITFNGTTKTVSTSVFGETTEGTFSFDTATLKLTINGVVLPIDTARLNEGQFTEEDLANLRVFSLTDSAMQIGIKRTYEGLLEDGVTKKESRWTMIYNFVVATYTYAPEEFTFTEPVKTSFTANDLVGTWKYATVPFDWVGWYGVGTKGSIKPAVPLNNWADAAALLATGWVAITQAQLDAAYTQEFVFNGDGTCKIGEVETTYSVASGVITFGESVTFNVADHWFSVSGTTVKVLDTEGAVTGGIWIGVQNEAKLESSSVHIVKQ